MAWDSRRLRPVAPAIRPCVRALTLRSGGRHMTCEAYTADGMMAVCSLRSRCWRSRSGDRPDILRGGEHFSSANSPRALGLTQPLTSKHLRVLRDAGFCPPSGWTGPRRWYGLPVEPLAELDDWLAPYRWMWESRLDHLDAMPDAMPGVHGPPAEGARPSLPGAGSASPTTRKPKRSHKLTAGWLPKPVDTVNRCRVETVACKQLPHQPRREPTAEEHDRPPADRCPPCRRLGGSRAPL